MNTANRLLATAMLAFSVHLASTVYFAAGLFDPAAVRATLDAHRSGVDCSGVLGSVLGVQLWHALYVRGRVDLAGVSAPA